MTKSSELSSMDEEDSSEIDPQSSGETIVAPTNLQKFALAYADRDMKIIPVNRINTGG